MILQLCTGTRTQDTVPQTSQVTWNLTVNSSIETLSLVFLNFDINTVMNTKYLEKAIYVSLLTTLTLLLEGFVA